MQFNTAYLKTLGKYGISPEDVAAAVVMPMIWPHGAFMGI